MSQAMLLHGAEPRQVLQTVIDKKVPAVMSYLAGGKWHAVKLLLFELGANRLEVRILTPAVPQAAKIRVGQPVGISLKYGYGKFIFDTTVVALEAAQQPQSSPGIMLAVPDRIEIVERRSYFRVKVPETLKVNVVIWHRRGAGKNADSVCPERYSQGRLVDISAGGAQVAVPSGQCKCDDCLAPQSQSSQGGSGGSKDTAADFKKGQFIGLRFTPMPYETPLMFNAQIRDILPTADRAGISLGLQIVGLEASSEGRDVLQRLCNVVERYYQMNQSSVKNQDLRGTESGSTVENAGFRQVGRRQR